MGLPFVFLTLGLYPALGLMVVLGAMTVNSCWLLLKSKDLCPGKPESLYELGFILFKRPSIFIISALISISGLGICILYFILFGKTFASVVNSLSGLSGDNVFTKTPFILGLGILLVPILVKKELQELHLVSLGLFISILLFIFGLFV